MSYRINLNSDVGEGFGRWRLGPDDELIPLVPTVNIACGFHAGDPSIMHRTTTTAISSGADIGAHVALPDLRGFGRRPVEISPDDLRDDLLYQIGALSAFVRVAGGQLRHVKPHGSLYAMCGRSEEYARALLESVAGYDPDLIVIVGQGWPGRLAADYGLTVVHEGYIDLDYQPDGFPRVEPMKQPCDPEEVVRRALRIVRDSAATAIDGSAIEVRTPTLCLHGDMPNVLDVTRHLRKRLDAEGIEVVDLATAVSAGAGR
ncbi:LamB/YcsF family protein [Pseudonocardia spinosispora]|uniref:LamB/YcsF family protein n=1 Tax=Pseudonocardia spinosispora TaxID=103441 RepID=UPI0003FBE414|nr:5-oxoprolinase subunit PxpA [Pseudonocardia spinosispora]